MFNGKIIFYREKFLFLLYYLETDKFLIIVTFQSFHGKYFSITLSAIFELQFFSINPGVEY